MTATCNKYGVYETTDYLSLPRAAKGWHGLPLAEIKLADLGGYWIWAAAFQMYDGDNHGSCTPLMDREPHRASSRAAAVAAGVASLRDRMSAREKSSADSRAVLAWLDTLNPVQMDLFA